MLGCCNPTCLATLNAVSSTTALKITLRYTHGDPVLQGRVDSIAVPLFTGVRLYNSVLARAMFMLAMSRVLCKDVPDVLRVALFVLLLKLFTVNTPKMPKKAMLTSLKLVVSILRFGRTKATLLLAVFTLRSDFKATYGVAKSKTLALVASAFRGGVTSGPGTFGWELSGGCLFAWKFYGIAFF